jgi:hypothetical protein
VTAVVTLVHMTAQCRRAAQLQGPQSPALDARQRGSPGFPKGGSLLTDDLGHLQNRSGHGPGLQDGLGSGSASNGLGVAASLAFETCR